MPTEKQRLIEALKDSNRCLGEAALRLEHIAPELSRDLLKQVQDNVTLIAELS